MNCNRVLGFVSWTSAILSKSLTAIRQEFCYKTQNPQRLIYIRFAIAEITIPHGSPILHDLQNVSSTNKEQICKLRTTNAARTTCGNQYLSAQNSQTKHALRCKLNQM